MRDWLVRYRPIPELVAGVLAISATDLIVLPERTWAMVAGGVMVAVSLGLIAMRRRLHAWWWSGPTSKRWERAGYIALMPVWLALLGPEPARLTWLAIAVIPVVVICVGLIRAQRREGTTWRRVLLGSEHDKHDDS